MERQQQIKTWLAAHFPGRAFSLAPASADASFRRYFRVTLDDGTTRIVMDAPPANEDCRPWLHVQRLFHEAGVHVPEVLARDIERGFLLLSDLGATTYLQVLDAANAAPLYADAIAALVRIQRVSRPGALPDYDETLLRRELELFPEWFLARHHRVALTESERQGLATVFDCILAVNLAEPKVFVHRDYHSRNLLITATRNPGILDFQDAVVGPVTYDLVSLLRDCYIAWPEHRVYAWVDAYRLRLADAGIAVGDPAQFRRQFDLMGLQRHIKVLGIFCRLWYRDGKAGYLNDLPLVWRYTREVGRRYPETSELIALIERVLGERDITRPLA